MQDKIIKLKHTFLLEFNSTMSETKNFAAENISLQQEVNILKSEALENKNKIDNLFSDDAKRKLHADQEIENMVRKIQQLEQINTGKYLCKKIIFDIFCVFFSQFSQGLFFQFAATN